MDFLKAISDTAKTLKGSFALEILCTDYPDNMIVVRKDSPLVIGKGPNEYYISSDIPAILSFTKDFYLLNNFEYAYISRNSIEFFDNGLRNFNKEITDLEKRVVSFFPIVVKNGDFDVITTKYNGETILIFQLPVIINNNNIALAVGVTLNNKGQLVYQFTANPVNTQII